MTGDEMEPSKSSPLASARSGSSTLRTTTTARRAASSATVLKRCGSLASNRSMPFADGLSGHAMDELYT